MREKEPKGAPEKKKKKETFSIHGEFCLVSEPDSFSFLRSFHCVILFRSFVSPLLLGGIEKGMTTTAISVMLIVVFSFGTHRHSLLSFQTEFRKERETQNNNNNNFKFFFLVFIHSELRLDVRVISPTLLSHLF
jgi:hypothetical protein